MIKKWKQLTIRTKIMLLYSVLSALLLAILIPAVYSIVVATLEATLYSDMEAAAENVVSCLYEEDGKIFADEELITPDMIGSGIHIMVTAAALDELASYGDEDVIYMSQDGSWAFEEYSSYEDEADLEKDWDILTEDLDIGGTKVFITVIGSVYYNSFAEDMAWILALLGIAFFLISVLGSRIIIQRALRPVRIITETAASVSENDRSKRIEGVVSRDEVGELATTFNHMLDDLETAFTRERQFTSDVSHELRTPLTVTLACADDALRTDDVEIIKDDLEIIKKENSRMARMISQLLFLSRGYEGKLDIEPEELGLFELAESVIQVETAKAAAKNISIHNDISEELMIYADQSLMIELFSNLIENAVKYGNEGGNVWIEAAKREDVMRILIRDDGIGIAEEDLEHIFERFYRADKARDRSGQGLGLSIAKQIVSLHGGDIFAISEEGKGSVFCVEI